MPTSYKTISRGGYGGSGVSVQWKPDLSEFGDAIADLRDPMYDIAYNDLKKLTAKLKTEAKANAPWTDRTGIARRGLFTFRRRGASFFTVGLAHGPRTIAQGKAGTRLWNGAPFYYGIALETFTYGGGDEEMSGEDREWMMKNDPGFMEGASFGGKSGESSDGHGTYAIIMPTMEANYPLVLGFFKELLRRAIARR